MYIIKTEMLTCFTITVLKKTWIALLSVTLSPTHEIALVMHIAIIM